MGTPNWKNRTLFMGDNLYFLRGMNSSTIDLIATDPPFNKGRDFHATPDSLSAGSSFQDRWTWDADTLPEWHESIRNDHRDLWEAIRAAHSCHSPSMGAFMCWLSVRLLEMHRILKDTGSIYVHCDQTANSYIRMAMDAIFGSKNFRNEIVWERSSSKNDAKNRYGRVTDSLMFYTKSDDYWFQQSFVKDEEAMKNAMSRYTLDDNDGKGLYMTGPLEGLGGGGYYEYKGIRPGKPQWNVSIDYMKKLDEEGRLRFPSKPGGRLRKKIFLSEFSGVPVSNLWTDIRALLNKSKERTGYATQKPVALYERIIKASCPTDGIVLDPFCGCATTCLAAESLGMQWVGMDLWKDVGDVIGSRMADRFGAGTTLEVPITVQDDPLHRTDNAVTAADVLNTPMIKGKRKRTRKNLTTEDRIVIKAALIERDGLICQGCDLVPPHERYLQLDHYRPQSDNGTHDISNLSLLCQPCNGLKSEDLTIKGLRKRNKKLGFMQTNKGQSS